MIWFTLAPDTRVAGKGQAGRLEASVLRRPVAVKIPDVFSWNASMGSRRGAERRHTECNAASTATQNAWGIMRLSKPAP